MMGLSVCGGRERGTLKMRTMFLSKFVGSL